MSWRLSTVRTQLRTQFVLWTDASLRCDLILPRNSCEGDRYVYRHFNPKYLLRSWIWKRFERLKVSEFSRILSVGVMASEINYPICKTCNLSSFFATVALIYLPAVRFLALSNPLILAVSKKWMKPCIFNCSFCVFAGRIHSDLNSQFNREVNSHPLSIKGALFH